MFDVTEVFTKCPKGCNARLVLCFPGVFGCPVCKRVFVKSKNRYGTIFRKTSKENTERALEILRLGKWKKVKAVSANESESSVPYGKVVELPKATDIFEKLRDVQDAIEEAKEALQLFELHLVDAEQRLTKNMDSLNDKLKAFHGAKNGE